MYFCEYIDCCDLKYTLSFSFISAMGKQSRNNRFQCYCFKTFVIAEIYRTAVISLLGVKGLAEVSVPFFQSLDLTLCS